jgi:methanogenic corrinoid protein MtbC1
MSSEQMEEKIMALNQLDAQKERVVNALIKEMVSLNMVAFERQLDLYIGQKGIEKAINEIIFPYLERVGILWVTNHINPAQEHLATNIVRQKIILGIERLTPLLTYTKRIVLFLPEGEYHELGLLYVHFLLKQKGIYVDYLGTNVPMVDLKYLTENKKVDFLYCHITMPARNFKLDKFFANLATINQQIPIILSGQLIQEYKGKISPNMQLKRSLSETIAFLQEI